MKKYAFDVQLTVNIKRIILFLFQPLFVHIKNGAKYISTLLIIVIEMIQICITTFQISFH